MKYDLDHNHYITETGSIHLPCPPIYFDSNLERGYIQNIEKYPIFCSIKPHFLIHKFVNVLSPEQCQDLREKWVSFTNENPIAHNTETGSSSRSSGTSSYHLGVWRRYSDHAMVTLDTQCRGFNHQQKQCKNFLRAVQRHVAPALKRLMERYTKEEWAMRKRQVNFGWLFHEADKSELELDFYGSFTTVAVTNGVSDILHTDRSDAGLTWVLPIGKWEGGDLGFAQFGRSINLKEGDAVAFQANFLAHQSSPLLGGDRLAFTCFTDSNLMKDSQKWKKK
ncbi:hypothetical protein F5887DRAFT_901971 [Amanita rubescens]|nr:hypothetical protein F5887DRAFT_901971 [Amanita rubescens]